MDHYHEQTYTFESCFTSMQPGRFDSVVVADDMKSAKLSRSLVGSKKDELMVTSKIHEVFRGTANT